MHALAPIVTAHTFGEVLRGRDLDWLSVEEVLMPPGLAVPEHGHEQAQLYFLLEGRYAETERGCRHVLAAGDAWLRPPRATHANSVVGDDAALTLIVTVEPVRYGRLAARAGEPRRLRSALLDEVRAELVRELRTGDAAALAALEGWSLLLLSRTERLLAGQPAGGPDWLADAVAMLERRFREPLSLAAAARAVGVHPATLAAAFRRHRGTSVGAYLRELRLRDARTAMLTSKKPLKQIAVEAGFYDQAHFGRCFRRRYGVTPAALRALRRDS